MTATVTRRALRPAHGAARTPASARAPPGVRVFLAEIVAVVGGQERRLDLPGDLQELWVRAGLLREALVLLSNEGLVERQRNRGAWVRPVSLKEAIEITEVRAVLEGLCAAKAATVATKQDHRELRMIGRKMTDAVKNADIVTYNATSQQVHTRVRELAGQTTAAGILDRLRYQSVRFQFHVSLLPGRPAQGLEEHLAIIDAVTSGDPEVAEKTMRDHLQSVIGALNQLAQLGMSPISVAALR